MNKTELSPKGIEELLNTLQMRFGQNLHRHVGLEWSAVQVKLESKSRKAVVAQ